VKDNNGLLVMEEQQYALKMVDSFGIAMGFAASEHFQGGRTTE
jgi:hypothetical protein